MNHAIENRTTQRKCVLESFAGGSRASEGVLDDPSQPTPARKLAAAAGLASLPPQSRRGAAFGDIANNGNVDVVLNMDGSPSVLMNRNDSRNHRVLFKLVGTRSNRAAIGARVTVHAGKMVQRDEVHGGSSYLSQNDLRLHFGLGANTTIDSVQIKWPSGKVETLHTLAADAIYTIVEGSGIRQSQPLPTAGPAGDTQPPGKINRRRWGKRRLSPKGDIALAQRIRTG